MEAGEGSSQYWSNCGGGGGVGAAAVPGSATASRRRLWSAVLVPLSERPRVLSSAFSSLVGMPPLPPPSPIRASSWSRSKSMSHSRTGRSRPAPLASKLRTPSHSLTSAGPRFVTFFCSKKRRAISFLSLAVSSMLTRPRPLYVEPMFRRSSSNTRSLVAAARVASACIVVGMPSLLVDSASSLRCSPSPRMPTTATAMPLRSLSLLIALMSMSMIGASSLGLRSELTGKWAILMLTLSSERDR